MFLGEVGSLDRTIGQVDWNIVWLRVMSGMTVEMGVGRIVGFRDNHVSPSHSVPTCHQLHIMHHR
jgi:hypothetical protein